MTMFMPLVSIQ